jgi:hypothetical protein
MSAGGIKNPRPLGLCKGQPKGIPVVTPSKLQAYELARVGTPHKEIARRMGVGHVPTVTKWINDVRLYNLEQARRVAGGF